MNKILKFGIPVVIVFLLCVFLFEIGSSSTDYEGQMVFDEQAPGTYELEIITYFEKEYNVYVENGKEVEVEIFNSDYYGAHFQTCEDYQDCDIIEENAPMEGFECIGRIYGGEGDDTYSIRFTMADNETAAVMIREIGVEEVGPLLMLVPIALPMLIFAYIGLLMMQTEKPNTQNNIQKTDYSSLSNETDTIEQRFRKFQNSENFDTRIRWDDGIVKVLVGGNSSHGLTIGMLLGSLIAVIYVFTGITEANWPMMGMAIFAFICLFALFLGNFRGEQFLFVYDDHLEVLYERMNYQTPEIHLNTPISDITEIKNYTREVVTSDASDGHTSSHEIQ
ncbi:MAG: hypothetical protein P8Q55_05560, partial [Candidatus Poseidoniaceae archaeon]|nr:hypothetical protein [Candidatus Poseidoniaceae archaeon]